jgi:predicted dehydrogenase
MTAGLIRFENGVRASFNVGMILGENTDARFDRLYIHGTEGFVRSDVEYNQEGEVSYDIVTQNKIETKKITVPNNYCLEVEQFGRCILDNEAPYVTEEFSKKNAQLIDRVLKEIAY